MAYLNPIYITDKHAKNIYNKETATVPNIVALVDKHVEAFAQSKGVAVDDIPVDGSGFATSTSVIDFARYDMYIELLKAFRGVPHGEDDDIYMDKVEEYKEELNTVRNTATKASILSSVDLPRSAFVGSAILY